MNGPPTRSTTGNFGATIRSVTAEHGSKPFLIEGDDRTHSYGQIDDLAARYAHVLQACGAKAGDRVLTQVDKCIEAVALYLACLRAGTVHVPLNPAFTTEELTYFISDAEPAVVVVDPKTDVSGAVAGNGPLVFTLAAGGWGTLPALADETNTRTVTAADSEIVERQDNDLAALLYTSGTTGRPKGAALSHANLRHNALALIDTWHFSRSDRLLHCLPLFHTHGLFVALHCAMLCAIPVTFLAKFSTEQVIDALAEATVFMGVPTHYSRLLADPRFTAESAERTRLFISGSAPLSASVFAEFTERTEQRICERYGMSETGIIASNPYHGDRVPGTVGYPLPGVELRVVDNTADSAGATSTNETVEPVGPGIIGSVEVRGPNVFSRYWRSSTPATDAHGWFETGDLGSLDESGRLSLHGRSGDLIISGGENIYPKEVELALDEIAGIHESAVIGLSHPDLGEAVTAVVVVDEARFSLDDARAELAKKLSRFKHPKQILIAASLPRNAMGKVQKNTLRQQHQQTYL